ncbi:hypothetical protein EZV62_016925 [Acer yangbiense]|uniref:Uncharacterized protein n=1 Tax=Acer yangbiense TaxID=1000413 RepID=A0A5C7HS62_9ROSI|nr:hypothetical protein EZV62_016925 [Acer yangbiense]
MMSAQINHLYAIGKCSRSKLWSDRASVFARSVQNQGSTVDSPRRRTGLFGLGWRDRNKGKQTNVEESSNSKSTTKRTDSSTSQKETEAKEQEP